jgi:hypothetical protein
MKKTLQIRPLVLTWPEWGIFILFCIMSVLGILKHEMWRDELQAWMVARDAGSFPQLLQNVKYEGNPALWHTLLFVLTRFTHAPWIMQVLNLVISFSLVFIFLHYSRFSILNKFLFVTGYFIFYEYNLISRGYGLGILLLFSVLALLESRNKYRFLIFILLSLLANTSVYGLIISGGLAFVVLFDLFFPVKAIEINTPSKRKKVTVKSQKTTWHWPDLNYTFYAGLAVYGIGIILSLIQIYPEHDNTFPVFYPHPFFDPGKIAGIASRLINAFIPIPDFTGTHFWNGSYIKWTQFGQTPALFLLLLLLFTLAFLTNRNGFVFWLITTCGLLFIFYYTQMTWWRYLGYLYITLIAAFWIKNLFPERDFRQKWLSRISGIGKKMAAPLLTVLLIIQSTGGIIAFSKDWKQTFAAGKACSEYIRDQHLTQLSMVGNIDYLVSAVSGFLDKPIFYPSRQEYGSFVIWDSKRNDSQDDKNIKLAIEKVAGESRDSFLLILSAPIRDANTEKTYPEGELLPGIFFKHLKSFDNSIVVENEDLHLYLIKKNRQGK